MIATLLTFLVIYAWRSPSSWMGRQMSSFAAAIARGLSRLRPGAVILFFIGAAALTALIAYAKMEGVILALPAGADVVTLFAAIDLGTYVEVMAAAWLLGAAGALRAAIQLFRGNPRTITPARRARRAIRQPSSRRPQTRAEDDDETVAWAAGSALAA